jgi:hypothetical protein
VVGLACQLCVAATQGRAASRFLSSRLLELLMGFEPMTSSLPRTCSTPEPQQLIRRSVSGVERVMGIEPTQPAWKAGALPLSYTRACPGVRSPESSSFSFVILVLPGSAKSCIRSVLSAVVFRPRVASMVGEAGFEPA